MPYQIKSSDLDLLALRLNELTGHATEYHRKCDDGRGYIANAGHYYIQTQHGGSRLEQLCEGGGSRDITDRTTKKQLHKDILHIILGLGLATQNKQDYLDEIIEVVKNTRTDLAKIGGEWNSELRKS